MVQPLLVPGYLENSARTDADMQTAFEQINAQIENSFAPCVLTPPSGFTSTGLSATFTVTSGNYFVIVQGGLQYFIANGDTRLVHTFTASQDTYVDFSGGTFSYHAVANNATPPTLAAGALRVALVVSGSSSITSVTYLTVPSALAFPLGGGGNCNPPVITSGVLTGEFWQNGNYTTTATISAANQVRLHVIGDVVINNPITVSTELVGGGGQQYLNSTTGYSFNGVPPGGLAPGQNGIVTNGGGGAGNGGAGGLGGSIAPGLTSGGGGRIPFLLLTGSAGGAGGAGSASPGTLNLGGAGGGGIYIEASGDIIVLQNISANGAAGANTAAALCGGGGGGSGGCIELRAGGQIYIATGVTLAANGGSGGNSTNGSIGGGGGGGGGGFVRLRAALINNHGTLSAAGGSAGSGSTTSPATAGGAGITDSIAVVWGPRSAS